MVERPDAPRAGATAKVVDLLVARGTALGSPQSSLVKGSRQPHMRELRIPSGGRPIRIHSDGTRRSRTASDPKTVPYRLGFGVRP